MVDLREELAYILENYGSDFLLIRTDKTIKCSCVDTLYNTGKDRCPICLGTGYLTFAERVKGRVAMASIPETLPRMINTAEPGQIAVPAKQFYLQYTIRPKRNDLIVLCEWDNNKPVFDEYTEIFEINESEPNRGDNGRIEYFIASAHADPINLSIKLANIKKNANNSEYYITMGDKQ